MSTHIYITTTKHILIHSDSDLALLHSRIPATSTELIHSAVDYGLKTVPEMNMHNREMSWPRGKLLGGCSSINAL